MGGNHSSGSLNIKITLKGLQYSINKKEKTAKLISCQSFQKELIIPRAIAYKSKEYTVMSIEELAFKKADFINSIQFPSDSELQTIEKNAFSYSSLSSISIPASLTELKEGWCIYADKLTTIEIDQRNPHYSYYDEKIIIGKSSKSSDIYDILVFARRDITEAKIPPFIKTIESHAFSQCKQLQQVVISPNSELKFIGKNAFSCSQIKRISIPFHVTRICENAFSQCYKLKQIDIPHNSELQIIENNAFSCTLIEKIWIPSHVTRICESAFSQCKGLKQIEFAPDSELQIIGKKAFTCSSIKKISIPSSVTQIGESAFSFCYKLQRVEIAPDSKLHIIEELAFNDSFIKSFVIPSSVTQICKYAFSQCQQLCLIDITNKSCIQSLIKDLPNIFSYDSIIMIPA